MRGNKADGTLMKRSIAFTIKLVKIGRLGWGYFSWSRCISFRRYAKIFNGCSTACAIEFGADRVGQMFGLEGKSATQIGGATAAAIAF